MYSNFLFSQYGVLVCFRNLHIFVDVYIPRGFNFMKAVYTNFSIIFCIHVNAQQKNYKNIMRTFFVYVYIFQKKVNFSTMSIRFYPTQNTV